MLVNGKFDNPGIDGMVERQLRNWELARAQRLNIPVGQRPEVADFIAITRAVGAGASKIASLVAARSSWSKFDKEILRAMPGAAPCRMTSRGRRRVASTS
jgi:hypothetical protein